MFCQTASASSSPEKNTTVAAPWLRHGIFSAGRTKVAASAVAADSARAHSNRMRHVRLARFPAILSVKVTPGKLASNAYLEAVPIDSVLMPNPRIARTKHHE